MSNDNSPKELTPEQQENLRKRLSDTNIQFQYHVMKSTFALFTLLRGMELLRPVVEAQYRNIPENIRPWQWQWATPNPLGSWYLDLFQELGGIDPVEVNKREGIVEQLAYRGWVLEIYHVWEEKYRPQFQAAFAEISNAGEILPEGDIMGDLGYIRNDLVHHYGIATRNNVGRCRLLTWFNVGDDIQFGINHIIHFLHQLGHLSETPYMFQASGGPRTFSWRLPLTDTVLQSQSPLPTIVSHRVFFEANDGKILILLSLAFTNGAFFNYALETGLRDSPDNMQTLQSESDQLTITPAGQLVLPKSWRNVTFSAHPSPLAIEWYHVGIEQRKQLREMTEEEKTQAGFVRTDQPGPRWRISRDS